MVNGLTYAESQGTVDRLLPLEEKVAGPAVAHSVS